MNVTELTLQVESFILITLPSFRSLLWLAVFMFAAFAGFGQFFNRTLPMVNNQPGKMLRMDDSTLFYLHLSNGACKNILLLWQLNQLSRPSESPNNNFDIKLFSIHGDVTYDYFYRSAIDTPFAGTNLQQHSLRANFSFLLAGKLPVLFQLNSRRTNSPYFKNYNDVNVQFDQRYYNQIMKARMKEQVLANIRQRFSDSLPLAAVKKQELQVANQLQWLNDTRQMQSLIQSRAVLANVDPEYAKQLSQIKDSISKKVPDIDKKVSLLSVKSFKSDQVVQKLTAGALTKFMRKDSAFRQQKKIDSLSAIAGKAEDSAQHVKQRAAKFLAEFERRKAQYEQAKKKLDSLKAAYADVQQKLTVTEDSIRQVFINGSKKQIDSTVNKYKQDTGSVYKWYKRVSAIEHFSLGRSMVDYSELTAKNISINGLQAIYHDKYYVAVATGGVDYLYRDFLIKNVNSIKQYLNLVQIGKGDADRNNLALTFYQGKKQSQNFDASGQPLVNKLFGITIGGRIKIDNNNYLTAEIAKSSYPAQQIFSQSGNTTPKAFNFSSNSNEAYTVQLFSRIPVTDTRIYGQYKRMGRDFQSFSYFNTQSDIVAWQIKVDQYFLRRKLAISAGIKTNDYSNPFVINNFKSNNIFKSLQATLRLKKWPVLSIAYMPSSQLTSIGNQLMENRFYTLMGTGSYVYTLRKTLMHSGLVYTKFYNNATDSGFAYYNASNWFVYHNIVGEVVSYNSAATISYRKGYQLITLDQGVSAKLSNRFTIGGGMKWNVLNHTENKLGFYANMRWRPAGIGDFNLSFDRGFIPGIGTELRNNDFGRLTYIKIF